MERHLQDSVQQVGFSSAFFRRVGLHRADTNVLQEVTKIEGVLISKLLSVEPATTKDMEQEKWTSLYAIGRCLTILADWQAQRRDTNLLMRIADKLGEFQTLPDIPRDALIMAHKIDKYIEYGTNAPPRRFGAISGWGRWKPWFGPTGSRVARIMDFRDPYNSTIAEMRERIFWSFHNVIMEEGYWPSGHSPHPMEENKAVWAEFARRAKVTEKERAYAERRVHTGE